MSEAIVRRQAPPRCVPPSRALPAAHCRQAVRPWRCIVALLPLLTAVLLGAAWPVPAWAQAQTYTIVEHESAIQLRLNRRGFFSVLAHDHVMMAQGFAGRVSLDPADLASASLQLTIPVASIAVDPQEMRDALKLEGNLNDSDRADIRENMLAEDQLDAEHFPRIVATLDSVTGTLPDVTLALRVRIKQTERVLTAPARVELAPGALRAEGELTLLQSDFGIEPYSAVLGAVGVEDKVTVRFRIVARAEAG